MANQPASLSLINNRYEILETLWTGGMGDVFSALDRQTGRHLAVKILDGDHPIAPNRLHRFKQEFRRTPDLVPPGAWEVYDVGLTQHGLYFMTLECFPTDGVAPAANTLPAGSGAPAPNRGDWLDALATPGVLEGPSLKRALAWLVEQAGAERGMIQILDPEGQVRTTASHDDGRPWQDQGRYCLERVRYDKLPCPLQEAGRVGLGAPIMVRDDLLGLIYVERGEGALQAEALIAALPELALALLKDRGLHDARETTHHLEMLNALSRTISATMDLPQILHLVLAQALDVSDADQGAVFWGADRLATLDRHGRPVEDLRVSQSVVSQVLEEGRSLSILDTQEDQRFATQASIMDLQLRSIMCVPLRAGQETRGLIYVSSQSVNKTFGPEDLEILEAIAAQVSLALETAQSYQTIRELNLGLEEKVKARTAELQAALGELQKTQAQLVQTEKMASLGQMVAGVAHELNNPLNFIHGNLKVLRDMYLKSIGELLEAYAAKGVDDAAIVKLKDEMDYDFMAKDLEKIIESCLKGATRSQKIVEDLKLFSGHDEADLKAVDLKGGLESTVAMVQGRFADKVSYELALAEVPAINAYGKQLNQVFLALLTNASQAISGAGKVQVGLRVEEEHAVIEIRDDGAGIAPEHLPKIFDPFFTTRPVGEGTGLGLTTSFSVVQRHNGSLSVESSLGAGTTATVRLPLAGISDA